MESLKHKGTEAMRTLNDSFLEDLKCGMLKPLTDTVITDTSLCLELRGNYINIYYRGGNLLKVQAAKNATSYRISFDRKYFKTGAGVALPGTKVQDGDGIEEWLKVAPDLKRAIDNYLAKTRKDEREFQQRILRDNNFGSIARSTDYYVCDIEYQSAHGRFDMIAVNWPSEPSARKRPHGWRLIFVEVKHGDSALEGSAGVHKHIKDVNKYVENEDNLSQIKEDMVGVFNQKLDLGLIDCGKSLSGFGNEKPLLLLAFVNHDPGKSKLNDVLKSCPDSPHVDLAIATASFLGYGLYDQGIHSLEEARQGFARYIYSR